MVLNLVKTSLFLLLISSLLGCKANEVEVSISTKDIEKAILGENISVGFDATLGLMAENDEEMRRTMQRIAAVTENYLTLEEFELTTGDFGLNVDVEGEIPLIYVEDISQIKNIREPWALIIMKNEKKGTLSSFPYSLKFSETNSFNAYSGELNEINIMLSPDKRQPIKFKIKNNSKVPLTLFSGGVEVNGEHFAIYETEVEKRISLTMQDGVYDNTAPLIYFRLD